MAQMSRGVCIVLLAAAAFLAMFLLMPTKLLQARLLELHPSMSISAAQMRPAWTTVSSVHRSRQPVDCGVAPQRHHLYTELGTPTSCDVALPTLWQLPQVPTDIQSMEARQVIWGTAAAQRELRRHQFPENCSDKKFLVHRTNTWGFGSVISTASRAFGTALNRDRIFLFDNSPGTFTSDAICSDAPTLDTCYFERLSSCSVADLDMTTAVSIDRSVDQSDVRILFEGEGNSVAWDVFPSRFRPLLSASPIPVGNLSGPLVTERQMHWWRSQATAFMVRPNARSLETIAKLRQELMPSPPADFQHVVAVHVRRGDKSDEAADTSNEAYDSAATQLSDQLGVPPQQRQMFLMTDDPDVLRYFVNDTDWTVYTAERNLSADRTRRSVRPDVIEQEGRANQLYGVLLRLQISLECGALVGTFSSNYSRLLENLLATAACKALSPFADAAQLNASELDYWGGITYLNGWRQMYGTEAP